MFPSHRNSRELFRLQQHLPCLKIEQNTHFCVSVCGSFSLIINACWDPLAVREQGACQTLQPSQDKLCKAGAISECCLGLHQDPWRLALGWWSGGAGETPACGCGWWLGNDYGLSLSHASPSTCLPLYCLQVLRQCPSCSFRGLVTPLEDLPSPLSYHFFNSFLDTHFS